MYLRTLVSQYSSDNIVVNVSKNSFSDGVTLTMISSVISASVGSWYCVCGLGLLLVDIGCF